MTGYLLLLQLLTAGIWKLLLYHSKLHAIAGNLLLHHWPKHWPKLPENVRYCKIFVSSIQSNANELLVSFLQDLGKNVAAIPYGVLGMAKNLTRCCKVISGREKVKGNRENTRTYSWDNLFWTEQREKNKFFGPNDCQR